MWRLTGRVLGRPGKLPGVKQPVTKITKLILIAQVNIERWGVGGVWVIMIIVGV